MRRLLKVFVAAFLCMMLMAGAGQVFADEAAPAGAAEYQRLTIKEAGTYVLTGSMHGSVYVDPGEGDVILVLENADIDGGNEPGIMAVSGDHLKIQITDHTVNRIADGPDNPYQAAIYTEVDTVVDGNCRLLVEGRSGHGIVTKNADFTVNGGKGLIIAAKSGFKADGDTPGKMIFKGGTVYVNAKEGIFAEGTVSEMAGGKVEETTCTDINTLFPECSPAPCASPCTNKPCSYKCPNDCDDECEDNCDLEPTTDEPTEIVKGTTDNSAGDLVPDYKHAIRIVLSDDYNELSISAPGTYIVSGCCHDGQITVEKETEGVILILENLNLTNVSGPALMMEDETEVKIIVEGHVRLATEKPKTETETETQAAEQTTAAQTTAAQAAETPTTAAQTAAGTETQTSKETADAAIMAGDKTAVYVTGDGCLKIDGGENNGISMGEESSLVIDGDVNIAIKAEENGITSEYDVTVLDGNLFIDAEDAGIHADRVITVGSEEECGPAITVRNSEDGLEATVVNVESGYLDLSAEKDGLDIDKGMYDGMEPSANISGGVMIIEAGEEGIESDGNVNLIDGVAVIDSENNCVEAADDLYVSDDYEIYEPCPSEPCEPGRG